MELLAAGRRPVRTWHSEPAFNPVAVYRSLPTVYVCVGRGLYSLGCGGDLIRASGPLPVYPICLGPLPLPLPPLPR